VKNFDPLQFIEKKELKKMDIFIQFAVAASQYAIDDAKLTIDAALAPRIGVFIGSGIGGFTTIEEQHSAYLEGGPRKISPFFIPSAIINLAAGQVSIRFGAKGPNLATCTACTASAHAIGDSFEIIKRGAADAMITRRRRSGGVPHGHRRLRRAARAVATQRTIRRAPAARSTRIATASCSAKAPAS
jgi:3-oxoacyl-[acyl-carrier-protein] synthase II